jgi:hypothetical protein
MQDIKGAFGIDIECIVDKIDYGKYLTDITIFRNPSAPYTIYKLHFDILHEVVKLFQEEFRTRPIFDIKLEYYFSSKQNSRKQKEMKLITLDSKSMSKAVALEGDKASSRYMLPYVIYAIPLKAYYNSTMPLNRIFEEKKINEIIKDIGEKSNVEFEGNGTINSEKIKQVIIPPMSFYRSIRYLDYYFSIYKESAAYCWFTDDKDSKCKIFCPSKFNKEHIRISTVTHRQSNIDSSNGQDIISWNADANVDNKFYGFTDLGFRDDRMAYSLINPYHYHFVSKPTDDIYKVFDNNLDKLIEDACFEDKIAKIPVPALFKKADRFNLYIEHTGFDQTDYYTKNWFFKQFKKNNELLFDHHGYIDWDKLIPGYVVYWNPTDDNAQKQELIGMYLLESFVSMVGKLNTEGWYQRNIMKLHRANVNYKEKGTTQTG